jgi:cardiolipin synthase
MISDGPDETLDSLQLVIMGAIGRARTRVLIMTPYFLPDRAMIACLKSAAISGVDVRVIVPLKNNWPAVQWALQHSVAELIAAGVRMLQRPPPFAHSKCILIDQDYTLIGSANLDPRSLRLNFELGIEIFDAGLNSALTAHFREIEQFCLPMTTRHLSARNIPARLRDSAAAMFAPYL